MSMTTCPKCQSPMIQKCPCGTDCGITNPTRHCPSCEPEAVAKDAKFHGQRVCGTYVRQQLGN